MQNKINVSICSLCFMIVCGAGDRRPFNVLLLAEPSSDEEDEKGAALGEGGKPKGGRKGGGRGTRAKKEEPPGGDAGTQGGGETDAATEKENVLKVEGKKRKGADDAVKKPRSKRSKKTCTLIQYLVHFWLLSTG